MNIIILDDCDVEDYELQVLRVYNLHIELVRYLIKNLKMKIIKN